MVGAVALGLVLSVETGLLSPVVVSVAVALVLRAVQSLPDPDPVTKVLRTRRKGMTEREAFDYLTMSNELAKMKEEEVEKAKKKARQNRRFS